MSYKLIISIFLISFWLFFPLSMLTLGSANFQMIETSELEQYKDIEDTPSIFDTLSYVSNGLKLYFKMMFLIIPNVSIFIRMFVYVLQLTSLLVLIFFIRGTD